MPVMLSGDRLYHPQGSQPKASQRESEIYRQSRSAVAKAVQSNGTGTAFIFDEEGHFATNAHVVAGMRESEPLHLISDDGRELQGKIEKVDYKNDLAVGQIVGAASKNLPFLKIDESPETGCGQEKVVLGYPLGVDKLVLSPIYVKSETRLHSLGAHDSPQVPEEYISIEELAEREVFIADGHTKGGNSGSPVLNMDGTVSGVVFAGTGSSNPEVKQNAQSVWFVPAVQLKALLKDDSPDTRVKYVNGVIPEPQFGEKP